MQKWLLIFEVVNSKTFLKAGKTFGEKLSFTEQRPRGQFWSESPWSLFFLLNLNETNSPCASCGLLFTALPTCPGGGFTWLVSEKQKHISNDSWCFGAISSPRFNWIGCGSDDACCVAHSSPHRMTQCLITVTAQYQMWVIVWIYLQVFCDQPCF